MIDNMGAESAVMKTSGSEKMLVANANIVDRQHEANTMCDSKSKELCLSHSYVWGK
jgi:hypothetical protein